MIKLVTNRKFGLFKGYYAIVGIQCFGCNAKVRFEGSDYADDEWDLDISIRVYEQETVSRWNKRHE